MVYTQMKGGFEQMDCYNGMCVPARRFLTKDEKIEMLEEYKERLDQESKGVAERIQELKTSDDKEE